jgi:hypothetical protein
LNKSEYLKDRKNTRKPEHHQFPVAPSVLPLGDGAAASGDDLPVLPGPLLPSARQKDDELAGL